MHPIKHPDETRVMQPPADWDEETMGECEPLSIADVDHNGSNIMFSLWQPTPDEITALVAGNASIQFGIYGTQHPVICVGVMDMSLLEQPAMLEIPAAPPHEPLDAVDPTKPLNSDGLEPHDD